MHLSNRLNTMDMSAHQTVVKLIKPSPVDKIWAHPERCNPALAFPSYYTIGKIIRFQIRRHLTGSGDPTPDDAANLP